MRVQVPPSAQLIMNKISPRRINQDFFKFWTEEMSYMLGYITADGCVIKRKNRRNSYTLNITSKDRKHLSVIRKILNSNYPISIKYNSQKMPYSQIQICNREMCEDLMSLGILPRKTSHLKLIEVSEKYFPDFVRGFFDGDGTVYIYNVNGTPQIKAGFISASLAFLQNINLRICRALNIPFKKIHQFSPKNKNQRLIRYSIDFYVDDCEKLAEFMYRNSPVLYLPRKRKIFEKWKLIKRRHYIKQNYPSEVGWQLNQKVFA